MRSLRHHLRIAGALLAVLVVVATVIGWISFQAVLSARSDLDRVDEARVQGERLVAAVVQQEIALRGYAVSGDVELLRVFREARLAEDAARSELGREVMLIERLVVPMAELDSRLEAWNSGAAEDVRDAVARGEQPSDETLAAADQQLQAVKEAAAGVDDAIGAERVQVVNRRSEVTALLVIALLGTLAGLTAYAIVVWVATRRLVLGPIDQLRQDAMAVAWGEIDHQVVPQGPLELHQVGESVEAMRQRIRGDLALVEQALAELEQRADELARSNRDLEQFAYVASHDLQEPLRKVASFCQLLQQRYAGQLDERADQYIAFAVDGAKRMQGLINDLLAFSRVGRTTEQFVPIDLDAVLDGVLADLAPRIEETSATIERLTPLPTVPGDRALLGTLLLNLVGNSIKFRAEADPVVKITAEPHDAGWCFTVADNGIGIEPEYAERVFVIFQRLHGRDRYEGTGIGLALCKKIVEFHGGTIWIDTTVDVGTTIHWTLPALDRAAEEVQHDEQDKEESPA